MLLSTILFYKLKQQDFTPKNYDKILVFDIDDTLYCYSNGLKNHIRERFINFLNDSNIPLDDGMSKIKFYNEKYGMALKGFLKHHSGINLELLTNVMDHKAEFEKYLSKDVDLKNLLNSIDIPKICLTNSYESYARGILEVLGIAECFEAVFHCQFEDKGDFICKPDPEAYIIIENYSGTRPENIYFFDDLENNVTSAAARGWNSVQITTEKNIKTVLRKTFKDLEEEN